MSDFPQILDMKANIKAQFKKTAIIRKTKILT